MRLIQLVTLIFVVIAVARILVKFKNKEIRANQMLFWSAIWTVVLFLVLAPRIPDAIATFLGIQRGGETMFFFSTLLTFSLIFRLYARIDVLDKDITDLTKQISVQLHQQNESTNSQKHVDTN